MGGDTDNLMTSGDVADMLHVHINTVRRWSDRGILKPFRVGPRGDRKFARHDVLSFLTSSRYPGNLDNEAKLVDTSF